MAIHADPRGEEPGAVEIIEQGCAHIGEEGASVQRQQPLQQGAAVAGSTERATERHREGPHPLEGPPSIGGLHRLQTRLEGRGGDQIAVAKALQPGAGLRRVESGGGFDHGGVSSPAQAKEATRRKQGFALRAGPKAPGGFKRSDDLQRTS